MRYNKIEENIGDIEPVVEIVPYKILVIMLAYIEICRIESWYLNIRQSI